MVTNFLLRYQERYLSSEEAGEDLRLTTNTKVHGETTDRSATPALPLAIPLAAGTKTAISGEAPDHSFDALSATALPRGRETLANETLTYTYVHAEAPRNDDKRQGGRRVLPQCS